MNIKINTICFIILLFLLVGVASAAEMDNETLKQTNEQPEDELCQMAPDNHDELRASSENMEKLEAGESAYLGTTGGKINVKISAPDVKMHYKDGSKFTVTVKDELNKAVKKAKVKITIDGKTYKKRTDSKGKASISLKLNNGKYTVKTTFDETAKYHKQTVTSTVTVTSSIHAHDFSKYYKNKSQYKATFYNKNGKLLKKTRITFKWNGKTKKVKTSTKGVAKLAINWIPGTYIISMVNPKTSETVTKTITIKPLIETSDLTMKEKDGSKFTVKVLNSYGRGSANQIVILNVNGQTFTLRSNSNGIASQVIDLPAGKYSITTDYNGFVNTNYITVEAAIKQASFSHITMIPDYVNVTVPYAFHNSAYTLKTGNDGIIKLPKKDVFAIHISETKYYLFSTASQPGIDANVLGYKTFLVPFDGSELKSDYNRDNLKGDGVLISNANDYTQIEFRSTTQCDADLFGLTMDKHEDDIEIITYLQNDFIKARIMFFTGSYDEVGLRSNLGKLYEKNSYEINYNNYDQLTGNNAESIRFTNTGESVILDDSRNSIMPSISREDIKTRLIVNGIEELEKSESISYGRSDLYNVIRGFEVLQSYAIINEKVTYSTMDKWLNVNSGYLSRIGIMNVYGMFLAGLETAWLADEIADQYAKELSVIWNRERTATIMGGINLEDTYLHILNADMGMKTTGSEENSTLFRTMNSIYLPNIEEYVIDPIAKQFSGNSTNSLDELLISLENRKFSIVQIEDIFYVLSEDGRNSTIMINSTSGIANVLLLDNGFAYKGSAVATAQDCCSICSLPTKIIDGIQDTIDTFFSNGKGIADFLKNKANVLSLLAYQGLSIGSSLASGITVNALTVTSAIIGPMIGLQSMANYAKTHLIDDKKDWYYAYDYVPLSRDSLLQGKKIFNIPKNDGTNDYIEVGIKKDGTLNRDDAYYFTKDQCTKLSESETYNYFTEEKWTGCSIPRKYQKYPAPNIFE